MLYWTQPSSDVGRELAALVAEDLPLDRELDEESAARGAGRRDPSRTSATTQHSSGGSFSAGSKPIFAFRVTQLRGARRGVQGVGRTRWSGQFTCVNKTAPEKLRREVCTICNFKSVFLSDFKGYTL